MGLHTVSCPVRQTNSSKTTQDTQLTRMFIWEEKEVEEDDESLYIIPYSKQHYTPQPIKNITTQGHAIRP